MDGKHIAIVPPPDSGSFYYNYKGFNSVVLLAIANANYEFVMCDVGTNGRISDGGVLDNTRFGELLIEEKLNLPGPKRPDNSSKMLPYVFVGDEAFALRKDFLKPFSSRELTEERRVFNYRLSRARRVIENVFGIMSSRFRVFSAPINLKVSAVDKVVLASCVLHNYLRKKIGASYCPLDNEEDNAVEQHNSLCPLQQGPTRNSTMAAKQVRDTFMAYFNDEGAIPWQAAQG